MKPDHAITNLATSLLSLALAISASNMAAAQAGANDPNPQTGPAQQQQREDQQGAQRDANGQQLRETPDEVQPDTDCIDLGPDAAADANAQGDNAENAQRSPEAIAQAARERDDCLDLIRNANGADANAQDEDGANAPRSGSAADEAAPGSAD